MDFGKEYSTEGREMNTIERLELWKYRYDELMTSYNAFHNLTGLDKNCQLMKPTFDLWNSYTESIAELVGDNCEWLKWYETECQMGNNPTSITFSDGRLLEVRTLSDLVIFINDTKDT